jgi:hypothetical protein
VVTMGIPFHWNGGIACIDSVKRQSTYLNPAPTQRSWL